MSAIWKEQWEVNTRIWTIYTMSVSFVKHIIKKEKMNVRFKNLFLYESHKDDKF